ncbi:MFS transporter [Burkholderia ambifaria]|uniref:MFS transporter n=1 Tax=Burkholderia ambifaria TaxID=152480 RepID=UPI00158D9C61|nr:MFS transporter [Burkholderia ambifaria]
MSLYPTEHQAADRDDYLVSRPRAWFAFAMTFALMLFDYIDRQVVVSLFPHLKLAWNLSDKQLGALVSVISIVVALGGLPVALLADRVSRVKSIFLMASLWSLASISCMFARNYGEMFAARALVGVGETGYGSVGGALLASLFPRRLRATLQGGLLAAASLGSVLGVLLGAEVAKYWGWRAAFGVVGVPGLVLALLYLLVPDYKTVALTPHSGQARPAPLATVRQVVGTLLGSATIWWTCLGAAFQLIVVSTIWSWLPSYFMRFHSVAPDRAAREAALVVLCGALGGILWGNLADRLGTRGHTKKLVMVASLAVVTFVVFLIAFTVAASSPHQFLLVAFGGFLMTCTLAPSAGVIYDVVHPGVRATGASILSLFQNLFGLAVGPILGGLFSDMWGLQTALAIMPAFGIVAALCFLRARRTYESDMARVVGVHLDAVTPPVSPTAVSA